MNYETRWKIISNIGEGGQGVVYKVLDQQKYNPEINYGMLNQGLEGFQIIQQTSLQLLQHSNIKDPNKSKLKYQQFREGIVDIVNSMNENDYGALKILHQPNDARDFINAEERLKREIKSMSSIKHPNLLKIIETDVDGKWFVSQYHPKGTLANNSSFFKNNLVYALKVFRPLVEGVSELHKLGQIHRDIKPQNIFIDINGNLVLGDFGLIHFTDQKHTRISNTWENVGSRDWQPAWSLNMRIEELKPTFDIFCLGKVLWSMLSGLPVLRLWYYNREEFNIEKLFPNSPFFHLVNALFAKCIVENENDCLKDASALLTEIDDLIKRIELNTDLINSQSQIRCKLCGLGYYKMIVDSGEHIAHMFGVNVSGASEFKIFSCSNCGNVQFFYNPYPHNLEFWKLKQ